MVGPRGGLKMLNTAGKPVSCTAKLYFGGMTNSPRGRGVVRVLVGTSESGNIKEVMRISITGQIIERVRTNTPTKVATYTNMLKSYKWNPLNSTPRGLGIIRLMTIPTLLRRLANVRTRVVVGAGMGALGKAKAKGTLPRKGRGQMVGAGMGALGKMKAKGMSPRKDRARIVGADLGALGKMKAKGMFPRKGKGNGKGKGSMKGGKRLSMVQMKASGRSTPVRRRRSSTTFTWVAIHDGFNDRRVYKVDDNTDRVVGAWHVSPTYFAMRIPLNRASRLDEARWLSKLNERDMEEFEDVPRIRGAPKRLSAYLPIPIRASQIRQFK